MSDKVDRRKFIKNSLLGTAGATLGLHSFEEEHLRAAMAQGASEPKKETDASGGMQYGKIGNLKVSRIFCGGNLIGGWAHSRDLIYVSSLVK